MRPRQRRDQDRSQTDVRTEDSGSEHRDGHQDIEFGLDSFVPISVDESGQELSGDVVIRNTVEEAVLADAVGIDSFNIAEHYRSDMMDSAGHVILAAIAGSNRANPARHRRDRPEYPRSGSGLHRIRHPRRSVQRPGSTHPRPRFADRVVSACLDTTSADYEDIFEEKLDLFTRLLRDQPVTWSGKFRSPLTISRSALPSQKDTCRRGWASVAIRTR